MPSGVTDAFAFSHVGLCTRHFDASLRFYTEGLGFEVAESYPIGGDGFAALGELDTPMKGRVQMLRRGGTTIELLDFTAPDVVGTPSQSRNQVGLTHLSFYVDDLAAAETHLVACGATVVEPTRMHIALGDDSLEMVFLADPNGVRIELTQDSRRAQ